MAALQDHARLALFVAQTYMVEMTSIELTTNSGQQRVDTLEGVAGFTPGSGDCTVSCGFAVPIGGQEYPFQETCADGSYVTLQIPIGDKDYIGNGKFMDVSINQSVNANTEGTFTWAGELTPLQ